MWHGPAECYDPHMSHEELIIEHLRAAVPTVALIYLFGSRASDRDRNSSDFDVAFLADQSPAAAERFEIAQALACRLNQDVDLIDLGQASDVVKVQVIGKGRVLFSSSRNRRLEFEMYALSNYARLNEERAPILEKLLRTQGR